MDTSQNAPLPMEDKKKPSIITLLWRGDLPLWMSFWIFSFIGNIVIFNIWKAATPLYRSLVDDGMESFFGPTALLALALALKFLSLGYIFLVCVGVWRSANKYSGPKLLGVAAKVLVSFYLIQWLISTFLP